MPVVTNHRGPSFREYKRTPTENKVIELEKRIQDLEAKLTQNNSSESATSSNSTKKKSTSK